MQKIDLQKIIEYGEVDRQELANLIFPLHKYPHLALDRVLSGEGVLDANQISRLSLYLGVSIEKLFSGDWTTTFLQKDRVFVFRSKSYEAYLDLDDWTTRVFKNDSLVHTFILSAPTVTLRDYFIELQTQINKTK